MAEIASINGAESAWFTPSQSVFGVFVEEGVVSIRVRWGADQTFPAYVSEMRHDNRRIGPLEIQGGAFQEISVGVPGLQYQLVTAYGNLSKAKVRE